MPMIDVYAAADTFPDKHQLAVDLAATLMAIEQVPDIPMFRKNTVATDRGAGPAERPLTFEVLVEVAAVVAALGDAREDR